ncbi:MAG: DUF6883 domain-containing protein [Gemmatimonadota bacterium]
MTMLPGAESALVPAPKLSGYLLSPTHPVGRAKARFFRRLGFDESSVQELVRGLLAIARSEPVSEVVGSPFGTKYIVDGMLHGPGGGHARVRTVWIVERADERPGS